MTRRLSLICLVSMAMAAPLGAQTPSALPQPSAREIASRLSAAGQGTSYVRLVMLIKPAHGAPATLQVQIKQRRAKDDAAIVYQILWPKEHKGESILLHRQSTGSGGTLFTPPNTERQIGASQLGDGFFGSNVAYQDALDDFYGWPSQALVGTEEINHAKCVILESKPAAPGDSIYGKVRSWIDTHRMVPLRIDKYLASGDLVEKIEVTRVANDDKGHPIPADLVVTNPSTGDETDLNGSRIHHDLNFPDGDFTPAGLHTATIPHGGSQ